MKRIACVAMVSTHLGPAASNLKVSYGMWDFYYLPSIEHVAATVTVIVNFMETGVRSSKCL